MRMFARIFFAFSILTVSACSTLEDSLRLGASVGALTGAASQYATESSGGGKPNSKNVTTAAVVGLGLGLITSYFIHKNVAEERQAQQTMGPELYFGDLPPTPFIYPKSATGGR